MRSEEKIYDKVGRDTGLRVPEGYFEDFAKNMMERLPQYPEEPKEIRLTRWQRIKPYVYMAAMFAGIWCMMKMFHVAVQNSGSIDNPPAAVVTAMQDVDTYEYFYDMSDDNLSDIELEENVSSAYENFDDFEADFGYELKPEYESIKVPVEKHS